MVVNFIDYAPSYNGTLKLAKAKEEISSQSKIFLCPAQLIPLERWIKVRKSIQNVFPQAQLPVLLNFSLSFSVFLFQSCIKSDFPYMFSASVNESPQVPSAILPSLTLSHATTPSQTPRLILWWLVCKFTAGFLTNLWLHSQDESSGLLENFFGLSNFVHMFIECSSWSSFFIFHVIWFPVAWATTLMS